MAQITVGNLEDALRDRLHDLANHHGRSVEEEIRAILRAAVMGDGGERQRLGSRLADRFSGVGLTQDIPEIRGQTVRPPRLAG